ncbi:unnamed protein product [Caenorhabditis angaria]|uniref:Rab-GAP TBC domain-containing protein n=1 Tax=Caenorhabditis angaria TaxID=860376 RepID=A0A9P1J0R9_9PELO|nr:unnamed protein product [Caenorhabditis angaria]
MAGRNCSQSSSLATVVENLPLTYNTDTKSLDRTPSLGTEGSGSPQIENNKFRRGHIRRSSYESAQIQLNFARRITTANGTPALASTQCFDESFCSSSMSARADCSSSSSSSQDQHCSDSGVFCDSNSKPNSLDRQSELSDFDEPGTSADSVSANTSDSSVTTTTKSRFFNFPKNLFSRKEKDEQKNGWRMFGSKNHNNNHNPKHLVTGLILEERPSGLPSKNAEEAAQHKQMYLNILEQAKKKEIRAEKERQQANIERKRLEEQAAAACRVWTEQILPKWDEMRDSKRCRELWWQGIPAKVRGKVWSLTIGNEIEITQELYETLIEQAVMDKSKLEDISLDATRTFSTLGIFQKDGPYYEHLLKLLGAYSLFRPHIGYVQSMTFIASVLLLQLEPYPAFIAFANLLERPLQSAFFGLKQPQMTEYFIAYDRYLEQELPSLHRHLDKLDVRPDLYLIEWTFAIFAKSLPLDITCRIWDVYFRDGEEFLFKTALGILKMYESKLLAMDFDDCVEFLTKLPADQMTGADLFRNIEPLMRPYNGESAKSKKCFSQIFKEIDERVNSGQNMQNLKMSKSLSGFVGDMLSET